jgi:hypothetical protein
VGPSLTVKLALTADLATRTTTADKSQDGPNILQLTTNQIEIIGFQGTQTFVYSAPLTQTPFFFGSTTDLTLTGDGSRDGPVSLISSQTNPLEPELGVDKLIFEQTTMFDDPPMEDGNKKFHVSKQVEVQGLAYATANVGDGSPVARFYLPDIYLNQAGIPIGFGDCQSVKYGDGSSLRWQPMLMSSGDDS